MSEDTRFFSNISRTLEKEAARKQAEIDEKQNRRDEHVRQTAEATAATAERLEKLRLELDRERNERKAADEAAETQRKIDERAAERRGFVRDIFVALISIAATLLIENRASIVNFIKEALKGFLQ